MGMRLTTAVTLNVRTLKKVCEQLGLPKPIVDEENYYAKITDKHYDSYAKEAGRITQQIDLSGRINQAELRFMLAWNVISNARIDWLMENDHNQETLWGDLYFQ